ncbi:hypothetical protein ACFOPQ_06630 [Deinococcus antarcticus]|uniref:Uncharacterized protein n=1 Tax=Deinococcus antarcticus TaxID=1298767 RepID=A0ABV8A418_9DEIO
MLKVFQDHDRLDTIIQENLSPIGVPQFNLQTSLDVRADAFAEQAAQRLMEVVQSHDLSPAQIREWAADMGREAQRQLNLEVITGARLSRDTLDARQGDSQGFTRMFREASDPPSVKLLKQAAENLQQRGIDPDRLYLTVARPGETHEGRLEFKTTRVGVVNNDQGQHLVTPAASLKGVPVSDEGRVQFTAREPAKVQRQMDY